MELVRTLGSLGEISLNHGLPARADSFFSEILRLGASGAIDLRPEEAAQAFTIERAGPAATRGLSVEARHPLPAPVGRFRGLRPARTFERPW